METQTARAHVEHLARRMYHDLRICGRLVAYRLSQLENVRLDEIRLALGASSSRSPLRVDDQLAAVALDGFAQLAVVLEREVRRRRACQNENIALVEVILHAVDQTQEICVVQLAARLVYLGMTALRVKDLVLTRS